jgi:transcriptional repressor NrdR
VRCPFCSFDSTRVVDSRLTDPGDSIRRRRECGGCGTRFTTHERAEEVPIDVVKRDGTTQRFDRRKLLRGLVRAAGGRPVGSEALEALADSIGAEVRRVGGASARSAARSPIGRAPQRDSQVSAERIGDLAERGLAQLDPVTAIQFASVYRRLSDLDELEAVVRRLRDEPVPGADQLPLEPPVPSDHPGKMPSPATTPAGHAIVTRRGHAE